MVSWNKETHTMLVDSMNMKASEQLIYKYTHFSSKSALMAEFDRIVSPTGTMILVYNLRMDESGRDQQSLELDVETDPCDILLATRDPEVTQTITAMT
jgi:hypothetical protein